MLFGPRTRNAFVDFLAVLLGGAILLAYEAAFAVRELSELSDGA